MTKQIRDLKQEIARIEDNNMTFNDYIRADRTDSTWRINRAMRKAIYANGKQLLEDLVSARHEELRASKRKTQLSDKGNHAYNSITKYRDEVMLVTA